MNKKSIKWADYLDIALALDDKYPECEILSLGFVKLFKMIKDLDGFDDIDENCNESALERIQMTWAEEKDLI